MPRALRWKSCTRADNNTPGREFAEKLLEVLESGVPLVQALGDQRRQRARPATRRGFLHPLGRLGDLFRVVEFPFDADYGVVSNGLAVLHQKLRVMGT